MQFYQVENQNFYEDAGVGDVKCSLTFKVGCLTKRRAYFETRRYPFWFRNRKMWYGVNSDVYVCRQQLSNWLALFPNLISIQKRNKSVIAGIVFKNWKDWLAKWCPDDVYVYKHGTALFPKVLETRIPGRRARGHKVTKAIFNHIKPGGAESTHSHVSPSAVLKL